MLAGDGNRACAESESPGATMGAESDVHNYCLVDSSTCNIYIYAGTCTGISDSPMIGD